MWIQATIQAGVRSDGVQRRVPRGQHTCRCNRGRFGKAQNGVELSLRLTELVKEGDMDASIRRTDVENFSHYKEVVSEHNQEDGFRLAFLDDKDGELTIIC